VQCGARVTAERLDTLYRRCLRDRSDEHAMNATVWWLVLLIFLGLSLCVTYVIRADMGLSLVPDVFHKFRLQDPQALSRYVVKWSGWALVGAERVIVYLGMHVARLRALGSSAVPGFRFYLDSQVSKACVGTRSTPAAGGRSGGSSAANRRREGSSPR
jgi:hypothetical protein